MTVHESQSLLKPIYSGTAPLAMARGHFKFQNYSAGDTVRLTLMWRGCLVFAAKLFHDALGAGVKVKLGIERVRDNAMVDNCFIPEQDAAAAGTKSFEGKPYMIEEDSYLIATITGAAATGEIETTVMFEPQG